MGQLEEDLKKLLAEAENKIVQLQGENANLAQSFGDMLEAQQLEAQQMVDLSEQIWALEDALASTSQDKDEALKKLNEFAKFLSAVQNQMKETLDAAVKNASEMEIAARVYELAVSPEAVEMDRMVAEYNAQLLDKKK